MTILALGAEAERPLFDEEASWSIVVHAHTAFLRRARARLGGTDPYVDDIVQEAFVSAFRRKVDLPSDEHKLRAWLFRAAKNHLRHHRRTVARELRKIEALVHEAVPIGPIDSLSDRERATLVRAATLALPFDLREAFVLVELEGMSSVEAAVVTGLPENTVRSRLRRARERFAANIGRFRAPG